MFQKVDLFIYLFFVLRSGVLKVVSLKIEALLKVTVCQFNGLKCLLLGLLEEDYI
jgi:hypothetical protein